MSDPLQHDGAAGHPLNPAATGEDTVRMVVLRRVRPITPPRAAALAAGVPPDLLVRIDALTDGQRAALLRVWQAP